MPADRPSRLDTILDRAGPRPATTARHGGPLRPGVVYTAQPDHHLLVVDNTATLSIEPPEHGHRPAGDHLSMMAEHATTTAEAVHRWLV